MKTVVKMTMSGERFNLSSSSAVTFSCSPAQTFIDGCLSAAGDEQRERHCEQAHRVFVTAVGGEESAGPVDAADSCDHHAGNQKRGDTRQESESDQYAAE